MINVSVEDAVKDMRREFRDLTTAEFNTGVARAINHTIAKGKTAANKEIRMVYAISAKDVNAAMTIRKASSMAMVGTLTAAGKPIPLKKFNPRQTQDGVSVLIKKGSRQVIRSAFMATMPSGHTGVFARGAYKKGGYEFRHKRVTPAGGYQAVNGRYQPINNDTPINTLNTISVPLAMANNAVLNALSRKLEADFPDRMVHELKRFR